MIDVTPLPHVLAALNTMTVVLLASGFAFIRHHKRTAHRTCMLSAVAVSILFLIVYLVYHFNTGLARFGGVGMVRPIYFAILVGHVVLAVVIVPLVPMTLFNGLKGRLGRHRRLARLTLPLWLYVAASGVVVYVMAIHLFPYV